MSNTTAAANRTDAQSAKTRNEHHRLLANEQRRAVLRRLSEYSAATVSKLAIDIVVEADDMERADASARDAVEAQLHHLHLPMLDDAGLVDYDTEANRVTRIAGVSDFPTA